MCVESLCCILRRIDVTRVAMDTIYWKDTCGVSHVTCYLSDAGSKDDRGSPFPLFRASLQRWLHILLVFVVWGFSPSFPPLCNQGEDKGRNRPCE